jgi:hypothetical protein
VPVKTFAEAICFVKILPATIDKLPQIIKTIKIKKLLQLLIEKAQAIVTEYLNS